MYPSGPRRLELHEVGYLGLAVRKGCERVLVPPPPEWAVLLLVSDLVIW